MPYEDREIPPQENNVKDVVVTDSPIATWRDAYTETSYINGQEIGKKVSTNERNLSAGEDFSERVEKFLLIPRKKDDALMEGFFTFAGSYIWYNNGLAFYNRSPTISVSILGAFVIFFCILLVKCFQKPEYWLIGSWRLFLIVLGFLV